MARVIYQLTHATISAQSFFTIVLLLISTTLLLLLCDTKLLGVVSASSTPPGLPHGVKETSKLEKACDKSRIILKDEHGFISSGPEFSNYTQNSHCEWLIRPISANPGNNATKSKQNGKMSHHFLPVIHQSSFWNPYYKIKIAKYALS